MDDLEGKAHFLHLLSNANDTWATKKHRKLHLGGTSKNAFCGRRSPATASSSSMAEKIVEYADAVPQRILKNQPRPPTAGNNAVKSWSVGQTC